MTKLEGETRCRFRNELSNTRTLLLQRPTNMRYIAEKNATIIQVNSEKANSLNETNCRFVIEQAADTQSYATVTRIAVTVRVRKRFESLGC